MIYWDIDGVVRNLTASFLEEPQEWYQRTNAGKTVVETVDEDLELLVAASPTEYYKVAKQFDSIVFITSQKESWRPYTDKWVKHYFKDKAKVHYVNKPSEKMAFLNIGDYLVEDYPLFEDNSKIILIDKKYNSNVVDCYKRIKSPEQLDIVLARIGEKR